MKHVLYVNLCNFLKLLLCCCCYRCPAGDWWYTGDKCEKKGSTQDVIIIAVSSSLVIFAVMLAITIVSTCYIKKKYRKGLEAQTDLQLQDVSMMLQRMDHRSVIEHLIPMPKFFFKGVLVPPNTWSGLEPRPGSAGSALPGGRWNKSSWGGSSLCRSSSELRKEASREMTALMISWAVGAADGQATDVIYMK